MNRRNSHKPARIAAALGLVAVLAPAGAAGQTGGLRVVGEMATGSSGFQVPRLLVDPALNLGFSIAPVQDSGTKLLIYDLAEARLASAADNPFGLDGTSALRATVDEANHRLLFPSTAREISNAGCASGPSESVGVAVYEILTRRWSRLALPCTSGDQFFALGISYHAPSGKLYALGAPLAEVGLRALNAQLNLAPGRTLLVRQVDGATGALDWETDLREAGCQDVENADGAALVERYGDDVLAYCYGFRSSLQGSQGVAVRIPLRGGRPATDERGRTVVRTTPTLPNQLFPLVDPGSGRMLLLTAGAANGNAVWVFDPPKDRFFGVIASGTRADENPSAAVYAGLDATIGRTYLLTSRGILVADARSNPLPAGLSYPVVTNLENRTAGRYISVAPKLRRIFVPVDAQKILVIDDAVPPSPSIPTPDPDRGTQDVVPEAGRTRSVYLGGGAGYGVHLLNTGGITRAVNNVDPLCYTFLGAFAKDDRGRCLSERVLTSGNRELFLASSRAELGSEIGASATATGAAFSSKDTATDTDFRRMGSCGASDLPATPPGWSSGCAQSPMSAFRGGTRGEDGDGFPVPGARCDDFGDGRETDSEPPRTVGPVSTIGAADVACDGETRRVEASATMAALDIPDMRSPLFSVARATSESSGALTARGIETTVKSTATGVKLGDFTIGAIETEAHTVAHGRSGTTAVSFDRRITAVRGPGFSCGQCDPEQVVDAVNAAFGQRIRVSLPEPYTLASPKGFQALAVKDPGRRASDRALNDDDTFEVPGLEVVLYNDGETGRSRAVVHLAGVQADSRFGIFLLPDQSGGTLISGRSEISPDAGDGSLGDLLVPGAGPSILVAPRRESLPARVASLPARVLADAMRLIVHNPREFLLLFALWSLLAAPVYLGVRHRTLKEVLQ